MAQLSIKIPTSNSPICFYCNQNFSKNKLDAHIKLVHGKKNRLSCQFCGDIFSTQKWKNIHTKNFCAKKIEPRFVQKSSDTKMDLPDGRKDSEWSEKDLTTKSFQFHSNEEISGKSEDLNSDDLVFDQERCSQLNIKQNDAIDHSYPENINIENIKVKNCVSVDPKSLLNPLVHEIEDFGMNHSNRNHENIQKVQESPEKIINLSLTFIENDFESKEVTEVENDSQNDDEVQVIAGNFGTRSTNPKTRFHQKSRISLSKDILPPHKKNRKFVHKGKNSHKCFVCGKLFAKKTQLVLHIKSKDLKH